MNVLLSPHPPLFPHHHETNRRSPPRSMSSSYLNTNMASGSRKRKADDDGDEMNVSPHSSPAIPSRQLARPTKKSRPADPPQRTLPLARLLETLDTSQLRTVLERICERHQDIRDEVVSGAPRPSVSSALKVLGEYQDKIQAAMPYGHNNSSSDYTYFRVKQHIGALVDAIVDFTPQYIPPTENQTVISLQYLDGATKIASTLPDWDSQTYRHHKDVVYDELSRAWALAITEAAKRGGGFILHNGQWNQILAKHNQQSGGRLQGAMNAMASNVGWIGSEQNLSSNGPSEQSSILNQLMSGTYGSTVCVGPW